MIRFFIPFQIRLRPDRLLLVLRFEDLPVWMSASQFDHSFCKCWQLKKKNVIRTFRGSWIRRTYAPDFILPGFHQCTCGWTHRCQTNQRLLVAWFMVWQSAGGKTKLIYGSMFLMRLPDIFLPCLWQQKWIYLKRRCSRIQWAKTSSFLNVVLVWKPCVCCTRD